MSGQDFQNQKSRLTAQRMALQMVKASTATMKKSHKEIKKNIAVLQTIHTGWDYLSDKSFTFNCDSPPMTAGDRKSETKAVRKEVQPHKTADMILSFSSLHLMGVRKMTV